jgi:hypothetical protein
MPRSSGIGSDGLVFDRKSDRQAPLLIQIEQSDGEAFFHLVQPGRKWVHQKLLWSKFQVNPEKKRGGRLDPDQIVRVLIADGAGR